MSKEMYKKPHRDAGGRGGAHWRDDEEGEVDIS